MRRNAGRYGCPIAAHTTPPRRRRATGLSLAVLLLVLGAFAAVICLHVLRTDLDPVRDVMSGYANGDYGLLMTVAFYALGVGAIFLSFRLPQATERNWATRTVSVLLFLAGAGLILAGIFEVERPGVPDTIQEKVHSDGAIAGFVLIVVSMVLFTYACHADARWRSFFPWSLGASILALVGAVFSPFAPNTPIAGIAQRVLGFVVFGWVILVAAWIRFSHSVRRGAPVPEQESE